MRVVLAQIASPDDESLARRLERVEQELLHLDRATDFIMLPELWGVGYMHFDAYEAAAEPLRGPTAAMAARVARRLDAFVHLGSIVERAPTGTLRNTSAVIDPGGRFIHVFSKLHVFGYESRETELIEPGRSLPVAATPFGRLAGTTCYDLRFPGLWDEISRRGAELAAIPAAWPAARRAHWDLLTRARAVEHQLLVFACNASGRQNGIELGGASRIIAPDGEVVAEAGSDEELLIADVDPSRIAEVRAGFPVIADRLDGYAHLATTAVDSDASFAPTWAGEPPSREEA